MKVYEGLCGKMFCSRSNLNLIQSLQGNDHAVLKISMWCFSLEQKFIAKVRSLIFSCTLILNVSSVVSDNAKRSFLCYNFDHLQYLLHQFLSSFPTSRSDSLF